MTIRRIFTGNVLEQITSLLPVIFVFLFVYTSVAEVLIKPDDPAINYYGRFDMSGVSSQVSFNWPGSIIEAAFPGPSIGVELNDGGGSYFNVEIDGVLIDSIEPSNNTHRTIRANLSTVSNHTIRIILRTNGKTCSFGGFYLADGSVLAKKPVQSLRKIEFIGDSWTAGDVMLQNTSPSDLKYFNAALSYARLTSMAFHAQDRLIARGGCGMEKSYGDAPAMPVRYLQTLCDGTVNWDFTTWIPDLVVIFLGINDFNSGATDAGFKTTYTSFVKTVRSHYSNVPIILIGLEGNILNDVESVAKSFTDIYTLSSPVTLANASALWQHPNPSQHRQIANALIPVVKQATGWDTAAVVKKSEPYLQKQCKYLVNPNPVVMKTTLDVISLPADLSGKLKRITVYDHCGRTLKHYITGSQSFFLKKDLGLPAAMYIIKTVVLE